MPLIESPPGSGHWIYDSSTGVLDPTWATVNDVGTLLGVSVTGETLVAAARAIEASTGLIEAVERTNISDRDLYWLKLAVCYQAAWMTEQPDALTRNDVATASQDGQSATMRPDGLVLAPLARRTLKKLSWMGTRTLQPASPSTSRDPLSEAFDDALPWAPV